MGGISWIRRSELTTHRDKMNFLTSIITLHAVVQSSQAQVVHAAPVLSTPALATAGYAVGASGAVGGQAPVVLSTAPITYTAPVPALAHYTAADIVTHNIPAEYHSIPIEPFTTASLSLLGHHLGKRDIHHGVYGGLPGAYGLPVGLKSAPCVNVYNIPVPCAQIGHYLGYPGLYHGLG